MQCFVLTSLGSNIYDGKRIRRESPDWGWNKPHLCTTKWYWLQLRMKSRGEMSLVFFYDFFLLLAFYCVYICNFYLSYLLLKIIVYISCLWICFLSLHWHICFEYVSPTLGSHLYDHKSLSFTHIHIKNNLIFRVYLLTWNFLKICFERML